MKSMFFALALVCSFAHAKQQQAHRDNGALFPQPTANLDRGSAPNTPELLNPAFHAKVPAGSVTLTWKASAGADTYHVQVATDPNFKWLKADEHGVKAPNFEVKGLEAGKTYYWRVAPWKNGNVAATNKGTFAPSVFETE